MAYHPFRHLGLKFIALAVAFGLWFTVAGEETVERTMRVPLETQNWPERLMLVDDLPDTVFVRVRGRSGLLSQLEPANLMVMVDLTSAKEGRRYFALTPKNVRAPFGVDVLDVSPSSLPLRFEPLRTKTVPIVAAVEGTPAEGYLADKPAVEPKTVEVTGPVGALAKLTEVSTEPVSIAGAHATVEERVALGLADPSLKIDPVLSAKVRVRIVALPVERLLAHVPIHLRNARERASAQAIPAEVSVLARGPADVLQAMSPDSVPAHVDLAGLGPGRYNLSVRVDPGQPFVVLRVDPATVSVRIK